jgi:hypothetical protein
MKRMLALTLAIVSTAVVLMAAAPASAKTTTFTIRFESEPFILDLSDPAGSTQCDVQAVGYDTGVAVGVYGGLATRPTDIYIQSLSTVLTNPDNGKTVVVRYALVTRTSFSETEDAFIVTLEYSGLNLRSRSNNVTLAGQGTITLEFSFADPTQVTIIEDFTPHLDHAYQYLCAWLA